MASKFDGQTSDGIHWSYLKDKDGKTRKGTNGKPLKSYTWRYRDAEGKSRQVTGRNLDQVRVKRDEIRDSLNKGLFVDPKLGDVSVKEYAERWLAAKKPLMDSRTWMTHESRIRVHVIPKLGHYRLKALNARILEEFQAYLSEGRSNSTVRQYFTTMNMILKDALNKGDLAKDPRIGMDKIKSEWAEKKHPYSAEEIAAIERIAPEDLLTLIQVARGTGIRIGELKGLCADQIDLTPGREVIHVDRQIGPHSVYGTVLKDPKSRKGDRIVPLSAWVARLLREHLKANPPKAHKITRIRRDKSAKDITAHLVFAREDGSPLKDHDIYAPWNAAVRQAGIRDKGDEAANWHRLRHTFAADLIGQGLDLYWVSKVLGHSTVRITEEHYAHLRRESLDQVRRIMDAAWTAVPRLQVVA